MGDQKPRGDYKEDENRDDCGMPDSSRCGAKAPQAFLSFFQTSFFKKPEERKSVTDLFFFFSGRMRGWPKRKVVSLWTQLSRAFYPSIVFPPCPSKGELGRLRIHPSCSRADRNLFF